MTITRPKNRLHHSRSAVRKRSHKRNWLEKIWRQKVMVQNHLLHSPSRLAARVPQQTRSENLWADDYRERAVNARARVRRASNKNRRHGWKERQTSLRISFPPDQ